MDAITYSAARANLASTMDRVCNDHETLIITRNGEQSVVMLSLEDFKALEETAYLLRNPTNAKRLLAAAGQLNAGKGVVRKSLFKFRARHRNDVAPIAFAEPLVNAPFSVRQSQQGGGFPCPDITSVLDKKRWKNSVFK